MSWVDYAVLAAGFGLFSLWSWSMERLFRSLEKQSYELTKMVLRLIELQEMDRE